MELGTEIAYSKLTMPTGTTIEAQFAGWSSTALAAMKAAALTAMAYGLPTEEGRPRETAVHATEGEAAEQRSGGQEVSV